MREAEAAEQALSRARRREARALREQLAGAGVQRGGLRGGARGAGRRRNGARREAELALVRARAESGRGRGGRAGRGARGGRSGPGAEEEAARPRGSWRSTTSWTGRFTDLRDRPQPAAPARPLGAGVSGFLRDLTNGRYTELELDEDYVATISRTGEPKPVISGGEEDIANLALRLAISQMIADRAGQPLSLLVLDEIFGSLDEERRAAVVDLLRSLADRFPQVILITHIDAVREGFDRVVRVGLRRGARRRAWSGTKPRGVARWPGGLTASVHGPERADGARHRAAQPGLLRGVHRPLPPGRDGRRAGAAPQSGHLALRARGRRRGRDGLARRRRRAVRRSTWCTTPGAKAGWGRWRCAPTGRAPGSARRWCWPAIDWLRERGARTIGLETMPRTIENIGFYSRLGFVPGHLTVTLVRDLPRRPALHPEVLSTAGPTRAERLRACRELTDALRPGIDFTRELALTARAADRRHDAGARRRRRARGLRALAYRRRWRRAGRRTSCGSSSWWPRTGTPSSG